MSAVHGTLSPDFWSGKRVFLTGHTGFKGGWLTFWLHAMGAQVTGYALRPETDPSLWDALQLSELCTDIDADVRDAECLREAMVAAHPDVVLHLAAQPLVRDSYVDPLGTYATNVMGTAHVLEAIRSCPSVRVALMVTTDKCYENRKWPWGYREIDPLGGYDPYSSSKAAAELVTAAYRRSFFHSNAVDEHRVVVCSVRAGNVIGGGDWAKDRLVCDAIRSFSTGTTVLIRRPMSTRPWQHVLEPLRGYLLLAERAFQQGSSLASAFNFGPDDRDVFPVRDVIGLLVAAWGPGATWSDESEGDNGPHEARLLKLDCSKAWTELGWRPAVPLERCLVETVRWYRVFYDGVGVDALRALTREQLDTLTRGDA